MKKHLGILILMALGLRAEAADPVLLKTGREVLASYSSILGISQTDPDVVALYQQDGKRLPQQGLPAELSNNAVLAMTELGGLFCQKAIARETPMPAAQRTLFPNIDFTQGPAQFDSYTVGLILENLAVNFWQRDVTDSETQAISKAITTASTGATNTPDQTTYIAQMLCTLYASSVAFLVK